MGLFNFGGSKSASDSRSFSSSFDNLDSVGLDFGFNTSRSESAGGGSSFSRSGQEVAFADVFQELFGAAGGAAGRAAGGAGGVTSAANLLFNTGGDFLENLAGGGVGAEFLEGRLAGGSELADQQVGQLGSDLSRFLAEDVNPAITSGGVAAGTFGGTRGEVQRGVASRGASEAFVRGSTDIRQREQQSRDAIAGQLLGSETDRAATGLGALPNLFGLAEGGNLAELSPFLALSQILGPQLALTESEGGSEQFSQALAEALGLNVGFNQTTGRAGSTSESTSRSRGTSFNLGFE